MQRIIHTILYIVLATFLVATASACKRKAQIPENAATTDSTLAIYPDYKDVTIPPNIAPLNFMATFEAQDYVASLTGEDGQEIVVGSIEGGKFIIDADEWKKLLQANKGKSITITVYAKQEGTWIKFAPFKMHVANEDIDAYLSYRLIEPSYELYRQLGLYQRNLTNFDEYPIYENNRNFDMAHNHCINCHNFQNYDTDRMLFHVRAEHGGTIFYDHGNIKKMNMRADSVLANCVYPTWHPTRNWVVFSSNLTGQAFHMTNLNKIEVIDYGSDLVFYDADKGSLTNILKTNVDMETFPCWSPDGKRLYYCSAHFEPLTNAADSTRSDSVLRYYDKVFYDIMSMDFDEKTRTFGQPRMEVNCSAMKMSATVPRISPDGRYLLFTMGGYGQFHIWHKDSDLWIKDLKTGDLYPLSEANSPEVDSYHTWSSNGRWIVFSTRREDKNFSRPAIAYFDKDGKPHKAFILPQEDPEYHQLFFKSYNVPELTKSAVKTTPEQLKKVVYDDASAGKVSYTAKPTK